MHFAICVIFKSKSMNKLATTFLLIQLSLFSFSSIQAQDSTINKKPGNLWGLAYGDFAWKIKSDSLNRGGLNQYTGLTEGQTLFQIDAYTLDMIMKSVRPFMRIFYLH